MNYDLSDKKDLRAFEVESDIFTVRKSLVELKEVKRNRTTQQNSALHKFFVLISEQLNELGMEYRYFGLKGQEISLKYTPELVKMFFWKPIQVALFNYESTTKLNTKEMNEIIDIIIKFFGDKGVLIEFPNREHLK